MRILQLHNAYRAGKGGEDTVLENERRLLTGRGHEVAQQTVTTDPGRVSGLQLVRTARNSVYSSESRALVRKWVEEVRPDVVHVHNTFPILSPSVFHELHALSVPTVLTLHNYRLLCANALFLRDGKPCDRCVGGSPLQAVRHRCYRGSLGGSSIQAATRVVHDRLGTFTDKVDAMIALSEFAKSMFVRSGIPASHLHVKPNFVDASSVAPVAKERTVVFVGKIVAEKGVEGLLRSWDAARPVGWRLQIVGDGVERAGLQETFAGLDGVTWLGWKEPDEVREIVARASWLVLPSVWYEGFPMALLEGFAEGTPAIVPSLGAMPEIVGHGNRGLIYDGSVDGLTRALREATNLAESDMESLRHHARQAVEGPYSPEANGLRLEEIYRAAIERVETRDFPRKGLAALSKVALRPLAVVQMPTHVSPVEDDSDDLSPEERLVMRRMV